MRTNHSLLAAALVGMAGGTADAQTSVTVYGLLDLAAISYKGDVTGVKASDRQSKGLLGGGMSTSRWGLQGAEDLGDGAAAFFDLSSFIRPDTGAFGRSDAIGVPVNVAADPYWSRASFIGLRSRAWGSLRLGNISTPMFIGSITSNAFGDSMAFSPIQLVTFVGGPLSGGTAWTNSIAYDSPNWSGFALSLIGSASEGQAGRNVGGRASYAKGDFSTSLAWQNAKKNPLTFADGTTSNNTTAWQLAGTYDFRVAKVFAHVGKIENKGTEAVPLDVSYKIWDVSASMPVGGVGFVLAGYARRKTSDAVGAQPASVSGGNIERQVFTLAYDYFLSKRTDLYAVYSQDKTLTKTLPAPGAQVPANGNVVALGIRHRF